MRSRLEASDDTALEGQERGARARGCRRCRGGSARVVLQALTAEQIFGVFMVDAGERLWEGLVTVTA